MSKRKEAVLDDFVDQLNNPYRDWPMYFTSEDVLCKRAAEIITKLRKRNKRLRKMING